MLKNRASAERSRKRKQVPLPPESPPPRHPCRSTPGCGGRKSDGRELVLCTLHDAITPGVNGLLRDFFDPGGLADTLVEICRDPATYAPLRAAARATALERFDRATVGVPTWLKLIDEVMAR